MGNRHLQHRLTRRDWLMARSGVGVMFFGIFLLRLKGLSATLRTLERDEYEVKQAFLYNFPKFIEWPGNAFRNRTSPFCISVLGDDPFGTKFEKYLSDKTIQDRPILYSNLPEYQTPECHILFMTEAHEPKNPSQFEYWRKKHILTVGESRNFIQKGGIINFVKIRNSIKFQINVKAADEAKLKFSSKLLQLGLSSDFVEKEGG